MVRPRTGLRQVVLVLLVLAVGFGLGPGWFGATSAWGAHDGTRTYRLVMVSHIGPWDPNMRWLTLSLEEFEKRYPNVTTEYVYPDPYSLEAHLRLIEEVAASKPDGMAVPIVDSQAMDGPLRKVIASGIPMVAYNIPDNRPEGERIPYLTYVGGDEYKTGNELAKYALAQAEAGHVPRPTRVICGNQQASHQGLMERCRGVTEAMAPLGVPVENVNTTADRETATEVLGAYLRAHPDTNYIFGLSPLVASYAWEVADGMGLDPDVDDRGMTVVGVDGSPISIDGVKEGHLLASNSQGFWMQGYGAMEWLYWKLDLDYDPRGDVITGPILITADNVEEWEALVRHVLGDLYDRLSTW